MRKNENIARFSADRIRRKLARGESKTDWKRADAISQAEVERLADKNEGVLPAGWESTGHELDCRQPSKIFTFVLMAIFSTGSRRAAEVIRHVSTRCSVLSYKPGSEWNASPRREASRDALRRLRNLESCGQTY